MNDQLMLTFDPVYIPALNLMYAADRYERARIAKQAHKDIAWLVREQVETVETYTVPVEIAIWAYGVQPRDVDASAKVILDGLVKAKVIANDDWRHVPDCPLHTRKCQVGTERIEVFITPLTGA